MAGTRLRRGFDGPSVLVRRSFCEGGQVRPWRTLDRV